MNNSFESKELTLTKSNVNKPQVADIKMKNYFPSNVKQIAKLKKMAHSRINLIRTES